MSAYYRTRPDLTNLREVAKRHRVTTQEVLDEWDYPTDGPHDTLEDAGAAAKRFRKFVKLVAEQRARAYQAELIRLSHAHHLSVVRIEVEMARGDHPDLQSAVDELVEMRQRMPWFLRWVMRL